MVIHWRSTVAFLHSLGGVCVFFHFEKFREIENGERIIVPHSTAQR